MSSEHVASWILEHGTFVWRVLRHLGVAEQQLEDLSQEVFIVMFRQAPRFEGRSSPRSWIYAICRNVAANARRRQRRKPETLTGSVPEVATAAAQTEALQRSRAQTVLRSALSQLPQVTRMVFVMYEFERMRMAQIAEVLALSATSGYTKLREAREQLRVALIAAGIEDADLADVG